MTGLQTFTLVHVAISLVGIASGVIVLIGMLRGTLLTTWTAVFLATTVATSVTGFVFPFDHLLPSHVVGLLSLAALALAIAARHVGHLSGVWRPAYIVSSLTALYFNVFVLIVQSFQKVPALREAAPTQSEPPFLAAQLVALVLFVTLTSLAILRFRPRLTA